MLIVFTMLISHYTPRSFQSSVGLIPNKENAKDLLTLWEGVISTHWGRVTHICVNKLTAIGSGNGLSPERRQAIIWTNAGILLIGTLGTNFSEILIEIRPFSFKKMHLKMSSGKWRPFCLGLNVLIIGISSSRRMYCCGGAWRIYVGRIGD